MTLHPGAYNKNLKCSTAMSGVAMSPCVKLYRKIISVRNKTFVKQAVDPFNRN